MKIALGADHKGYAFKEKIKALLKEWGHEVIDNGTNSEESADYSKHGLKTAHDVAEGRADYGINICWTGNGMAMASNKVKGIRAGMALSIEMAHLTRLHNNANVLVLAGKYTPEDQVEDIVRSFLTTEFEGGRHTPRVERFMKEEGCGE